MSQEIIGNPQTELRVRELEVRVADVIRMKDIRTAKTLLGMVNQLKEKLNYFQALVRFLNHCDMMFDSIKWTDREKGRKMVDKTIDALKQGNISVEQLAAYTDIIWSLQIQEPTNNSSDETSSDTHSTHDILTVNEEKHKRLLT